MEKPTYAVGDRVEKLCAVCGEERGHVVASVTKRGQISRVDCAKCRTRSTFKQNAATTGTSAAMKTGAPYDQARTYSSGQTMLHPTYGVGEVMAIIEPRKIDVLFPDRMRRLVHSRVQA